MHMAECQPNKDTRQSKNKQQNPAASHRIALDVLGLEEGLCNMQVALLGVDCGSQSFGQVPK
jgi:hypothetical protein